MASGPTEIERLVDDEFEDFLDRLYTKASRKGLDPAEVSSVINTRISDDVADAWDEYVEEGEDG